MPDKKRLAIEARKYISALALEVKYQRVFFSLLTGAAVGGALAKKTQGLTAETRHFWFDTIAGSDIPEFSSWFGMVFIFLFLTLGYAPLSPTKPRDFEFIKALPLGKRTLFLAKVSGLLIALGLVNCTHEITRFLKNAFYEQQGILQSSFDIGLKDSSALLLPFFAVASLATTNSKKLVNVLALCLFIYLESTAPNAVRDYLPFHTEYISMQLIYVALICVFLYFNLSRCLFRPSSPPSKWHWANYSILAITAMAVGTLIVINSEYKRDESGFAISIRPQNPESSARPIRSQHNLFTFWFAAEDQKWVDLAKDFADAELAHGEKIFGFKFSREQSIIVHLENLKGAQGAASYKEMSLDIAAIEQSEDPAEALQMTFRHELTHLFVTEILRSGKYSVKKFLGFSMLQEGTAEYIEYEQKPLSSLELNSLALHYFSDTQSFYDILRRVSTGSNSDKMLVYRYGRLLISHMVDELSWDGYKDFLLELPRLKPGKDFGEFDYWIKGLAAQNHSFGDILTKIERTLATTYGELIADFPEAIELMGMRLVFRDGWAWIPVSIDKFEITCQYSDKNHRILGKTPKLEHREFNAVTISGCPLANLPDKANYIRAAVSHKPLDSAKLKSFRFYTQWTKISDALIASEDDPLEDSQ